MHEDMTADIPIRNTTAPPCAACSVGTQNQKCRSKLEITRANYLSLYYCARSLNLSVDTNSCITFFFEDIRFHNEMMRT